MSGSADSMAVLEERAPDFSNEEAIGLLRQYWGIDAAVSSLVSERDQNFRATSSAGEAFVLKIGNAAEPAEVTDFQLRALIHIARRVTALALPVRAPEVVATTAGDDRVRIERNGASHVVRLVTYVDGTPLAGEIASPALARNMGACLANLGIALDGFSHPGSRHSLMWDIQRALELRALVRHVRDAAVANAVGDALDDFEQVVLPALDGFRRQVIHSDMNPDNVLLERPGGDAVAGVIDFGDMIEAPLVADVAIAGSYLRAPEGDPLALICELLAGYHAVNPLTRAETDALFDLVRARLCASIAILDWRAATRDGDDAYLADRVSGVGTAGRFLLALSEIPRSHARRTFRQVCAAAGGQALS